MNMIASSNLFAALRTSYLNLAVYYLIEFKSTIVNDNDELVLMPFNHEYAARNTNPKAHCLNLS